MGYLSGITGSVAVGATNYAFSKWRIPMKSGLPKVTNFNTAPYQQLVTGILSATIYLEGPYDQGSMAFAAGTSYGWILRWTSSVSLTVTAFIEELQPDVDVEGAARVAITAQSSGSFTASIS